MAKGKGGRPSSYSEELALKICERLAEGEPLTKICKDEGMPAFRTVFRWEAENEQFRQLSTRARETGTHHLADQCIEIADDSGSDYTINEEGVPVLNPEAIQRAKLRIETRIRLIGKWNAKAYGEKVDLNVSNNSNRVILPDAE